MIKPPRSTTHEKNNPKKTKRQRKERYKMSNHSAFNNWFKKQYGKLPLPQNKYLKAINEITTMRLAIQQAEMELKIENNRRECHAAASYAWNITDKDKKNYDKLPRKKRK